MEGHFNYNGKMIAAGTRVIGADNRGFRYGDGVFETMRLWNGQLQLQDLHMDRLFAGIDALRLVLPPLHHRLFLEEQILKTCHKNKLMQQARVRLTVFRGDGGLYETDGDGGGFIIQAFALPDSAGRLNENGLAIGVFNGARKICDDFSNLKSNNYLVYVLAALYAKEQKYNDCLVLNEHHRVCDATIANVFWIREGIIYTPPLSEGSVAGVMRHWLLQRMKEAGYNVMEKPASIEELENADELFLTNAISGMRWVKQWEDKVFGNTLIKQLYARFMV